MATLLDWRLLSDFLLNHEPLTYLPLDARGLLLRESVILFVAVLELGWGMWGC